MRILSRWVMLLASIAALVFVVLWLNRVRLDYDSEGRYFDEEAMVVYDADAVLVYGSLALASSLVAVLLAFAIKRR
ncbi:MAG: hypothetical protein JNM62_09320 [Flavobacteriales bacterium]|nr:hypothetical protein [Flavobacteriales bacterium]